MSSIQLIAIETVLWVSTAFFTAYITGKLHGAAMQVYSGVADGVRLSRTARALILINTWGGQISLAIVTNALAGIALLKIGEAATSREAAGVANLFAMCFLLAAAYLLMNGVIMGLGLTRMIRSGVRGEPA